MALDGYNRAYDKKLVIGQPQSPLFNKEPFDYAETIFLAIANDTRNPFRNQYQNQLAQARQIKKDLEAGDRKVEDWANKIGTEIIELDPKDDNSFLNINTKIDLEEASKKI